MKHRFICSIWVLGLLLYAGGSIAQEDTAAQWADKQKVALAGITDASLAELLNGGTPALDALFAGIKTGGQSDPLASTRIAALTQYVMRPEGRRARKAYTDALLAAARRASAADVICFFIHQLRWCGLPQQAEAIKAFETSDKTGVAALAAMTVQAVTDDRTSRAAPVADTPCAALNKELAALSPKALTPRLLQLFDGANGAQAGVALAWARSAGGKKETALWLSKLSQTADPVRKIMLVDMLGARGDKRACEALGALLADPDDGVAFAAQHALIRLDPAAFAARVPALLNALPPNRQTLARDGLRQLKTKLVRKALLPAWGTFSDTGKKVALELLKDRRAAEAMTIGFTALEAKDDEVAIAGYRLLREVATSDQAERLVAQALTTSGRVAPEAQSALAAAARRDASGAYVKALAQALASAPAAQQPLALETAARVGGDVLLKAVEAASVSADAGISVSAVRALAAWTDASSLPALLRLAVTAPDAKRQTLALRGVTKRFNAGQADKKTLLPVWRTIRALPGSEANKKAIDELFKERINVVLGKPVTTDVPTEGDHVPANLVDGTLEKAWYAGKWPAHAQIDLGGVQSVSSAHVTFYHQDTRTYTFALELSGDGQTWRQVAGNTAAPKPATAEGLALSFPETKARFVRLTVLKNSANFAVHVLELGVFSEVAP